MTSCALSDVAVWREPADVPVDLPGSVVCIGVFDGVHRGHRSILARGRAHAATAGLPLVPVTFDRHPAEVVRPGTQPLLLTTLEHRMCLLGDTGVDAVRLLTFTHELSQLDPAEFVAEFLGTGLQARTVVVGANFRFGRRAAGDVETLAELGALHGFTVDAVDLVGDAETWSSTYIRGLVAGGDVRDAAVALARPHRVEGVVVHGDHRGRELGFPTANLDATPYAAIPADGIYAGYVVRDPYGPRRRSLPAAISVGTNPTFQGTQRRVESFVLDRDDLDLYGEHIGVDFVSRLRGTWTFDSAAALVARMTVDVAEARHALAQ